MHFQVTTARSFTGRPGSCSRFPGAALMNDGKIVILYDDGPDCDSPEHEMRIAFSCDRGRSWQDGGLMYDQAKLGLPYRFTENCKPTLIDNDELVSVGFGFLRVEPELSLSDYAVKYGKFPPSYNTFSRSIDSGRNWQPPEFILHRFDTALELSGPALWCAEERTLLVFGPPFVLQGQSQRGVCMGSRDRGKTWEEHGTFYSSEHIAPWEVRSLREPSGRIWLVFWAYDLEKKIHLNNQLVYSDDCGCSWSPALNTGIFGQAANLFAVAGQKFLLYTVREGEHTGIYCAGFDWQNDNVLVIGEPALLWEAGNRALPSGERIEKQFRNLKFGQPSVTDLGDGEYLLLFWSCEDDGYAIRTCILQIK